MLKKSEKEKLINEMADSLSKSTIVIATDYRGLKAKEMVSLRRQLRASGVEYRVAKNTLVKLAAEKTGKKGLEQLLSGPLAIAIGYDDVVKPAKAVSDFIRSSGVALQIKGGLLGDKILNSAEVSALANIPSKEILLTQLVSQMAAPIQSLHTVLSAPLRGLACVIQAKIAQMGGG
jgi:large subunit ribosomal protein L10